MLLYCKKKIKLSLPLVTKNSVQIVRTYIVSLSNKRYQWRRRYHQQQLKLSIRLQLNIIQHHYWLVQILNKRNIMNCLKLRNYLPDNKHQPHQSHSQLQTLSNDFGHNTKLPTNNNEINRNNNNKVISEKKTSVLFRPYDDDCNENVEISFIQNHPNYQNTILDNNPTTKNQMVR